MIKAFIIYKKFRYCDFITAPLRIFHEEHKVQPSFVQLDELQHQISTMDNSSNAFRY